MKTTILREQIYILHRDKPEIDLQRSPKDYLDLRDEMQQSVNNSDDPFKIEHGIHVNSLVKDIHNMMFHQGETYIIHHTKNDNGLDLYFSFGLPPHAISVTIN